MLGSVSGADELSSFSDPPQAAGTPPSTQPPAPSGPQKELSSAVGPAELEPAEVEAQTGLPEPQSSTPASSDGPPLTQTAPTSAAASTSPEATVGITIAVETSEWTGSSAPSGLQPTATTPKDTTLGPLLQELLTTLVSASSDAARGVVRGDTPAGGATNAPLAATHKPGQSTSEPWDKVSPTKPVSVAQSANAEEASSYQAGTKAPPPKTVAALFSSVGGGVFPISLCSWKIENRRLGEEKAPEAPGGPCSAKTVLFFFFLLLLVWIPLNTRVCVS